MEENIKRIDIKEFREKGYLQELNRQFLHPLGLALEIIIDDNGKESLGGIWDYREDEEGIIYDLKNSDENRKKTFKERAKYVQEQKEKNSLTREKILGYTIEPIE